MAVDKETVGNHLKSAKKSLKEKDFGAYWNHLNQASALLGGGDSKELDDEILNKLNARLNGPGS
jgi:hypothetical protein